MNIALIGFGAMGKKIKEIAEYRGHTISVIVDPIYPQANHTSLTANELNGVDVAIDFSSANSVISNVEIAARAGVSIVIGTTGWLKDLALVEKITRESGIGLLWSANFSIGVNMYYRIVEEAAKLFNQFDEYDVWGTELHHHNKADSPSGTAKKLGEILLARIKRKTAIVDNRLDRKIEPHEIHFSSTRGGPVNFNHTIGFDSASDTITITHSARDRGGYALGAVRAAEWLRGKKGYFTMDDFLINE